MWVAQISNKNTFIRNRDKLIEIKLIEFKKGKKGKPNQYKVETEILVNSPKKGIKFEPEVGLKIEPKVVPQIEHITEKRVRERVKERAVSSKTFC